MEQETKTIPAVEEWRPIKGYEGLYEVSNLGQVRSVDRIVINTSRSGNTYKEFKKGKIISQRKTHSGYILVSLHKEGGISDKLVHRVVAIAFIPNPNNLPEVNHKDEDKTNNKASNLEWCDSSYNKLYGTARERINAKRSKGIEQLTLDGQHVAFCQSAAVAYRMSNGKFHPSSIIMAVNGHQKTAYGYLWRRITKQIENGQPLSI